MQIIISDEELYYLKRAAGSNRILILLFFFFPMVLFAGIFAVSLAIITNAYILRVFPPFYADEFILIFALMPPMIFLLASRIYREKRLFPKSSVNVVFDGYFIRIASLELPISRALIEIVERPFLMPRNMVLVKVVFPFESYLYKEGELNLGYFYEYGIRGRKEVKNIPIGSTIAIFLPMKKTKLIRFIEEFKQYPNVGVKFHGRPSIKELFSDFEEKRAAKIVIMDFSFIGL